MASTKPILAEYSSKLDDMTMYIRHYLSRKNLDEANILRVHKDIVDFCYKNTDAFKDKFDS